jgi:3-oxoacyl-[acyl-carrier-protein] synthase-1
VVSTACSSSGKVLASARRLIAAGVADAVVVGGVDTLAETTLHGFHALGVLSAEPCRPFDVDRAGMNIGEGGAMLLVERDGEAVASLLGVGASSDASHMSTPHPRGLGARMAMEGALREAGAQVSEVDYINAHGTGTKLNDVAEARAISELFGGEVPVVSTKGFTGHLLGAAGATEAVFCVVAIAQSWIPANLGAEKIDPDVCVAVNRKRRDNPCRRVLSNSFGFGGSNVSVLMGAP